MANNRTFANLQITRSSKLAKSVFVQDYSVSQTSLEQVFLSFAKAQRGEDESLSSEANSQPEEDNLF